MQVVRKKFAQLVEEGNRTPEQVSWVPHRGRKNGDQKNIPSAYDVSEYTLCCFGGGAGATRLFDCRCVGMKQVFLHPMLGCYQLMGWVECAGDSGTAVS